MSKKNKYKAAPTPDKAIYNVMRRTAQTWNGKPAPWAPSWICIHHGARDYYDAFCVMASFWTCSVDEGDFKIEREIINGD